MTTFPKYERYKDSGIEWLGDVPEDWESERVFSVFNERVETGHAGLPNLNITIGRGVQIEENEGARKKRLIEDLNAYKRAKKGDIAYNTMRMWQGAVGDVPVDGLVSPAYVVAQPIKAINSRFYSYLFRTEIFQTETNRHSYGIVSDRNRLYWLGFKNITIPIPSREEQDRIVAFLDQKTAEIDALIAKKQRQIELLDEQKAILINRAVTRGLNPNAKLKPSGIEWIGEIPEHWSTSRLKHECSHIVDCPHATPIYDPDAEYPAIRTSDVSPGETHVEKAKRVGPKEFARWTERLLPRGGDILYSREGDWGIAAPVPEDTTLCISQRMMIFRPKKRIHSNYLMWQLNCQHVLRQGFFDVLGSTVPHVNIGTIANYDLVVPSTAEQEAIAVRVQFLHQRFKEVSRQFFSQIELLKTLRSALIAHAVTGRIKV